jgi:hypothetical protein
VGTFLAVGVSLWLSTYGRRPKLNLTVGERLILGDNREADVALLMFSVVNASERPVYVRGIGWRTGWLRWGPKFLKRQNAVQMSGGFPHGKEPPYELAPGAATETYILMDNVLKWTRKKSGEPFFTRDWPLLGRRSTRVLGYAYTADGTTVQIRAEKPLVQKLTEAEIEGEMPEPA